VKIIYVGAYSTATYYSVQNFDELLLLLA